MPLKISIGPYGGKVEGFAFDVKFDNGSPVVFVVGFSILGGDFGSEECATDF